MHEIRGPLARKQRTVFTGESVSLLSSDSERAFEVNFLLKKKTLGRENFKQKIVRRLLWTRLVLVFVNMIEIPSVFSMTYNREFISCEVCNCREPILAYFFSSSSMLIVK